MHLSRWKVFSIATLYPLIVAVIVKKFDIRDDILVVLGRDVNVQ